MRRAPLAAVALALLAAGAVLAIAPERREPAARKPARPPVVLLILDEFPVDSLLGPDGRIDAARFPNFARLARTSTWFPNAHTIYDWTFRAVPAMLDARLPRRRSRPIRRYHRRSIYDLFRRAGYGIVDSEEATAVCPPRICRGGRRQRPSIITHLKGARRERLERWIASIRPRGRPTLYVKHALLPHGPWIYLPSGRRLRRRVRDPLGGLGGPRGFHDPGLTLHNRQRQLLQIGFIDRELGMLLERLRRARMLDRAAVLVTADHGYSWEVGVNDRRLVTPQNVHEIAPVPLFLKAPRQRAGRVSYSLVRTLDILPTLAQAARLKVPWRIDGSSFFGAAARRRRVVRFIKRDFDGIVRIGAAELARRRGVAAVERLRTFAWGEWSRQVYGSPWTSVYRVGPHAELIGRPLAALGIRRRARVRVKLSETGPQVAGRVLGGRPGALRDIAVSVNGRVAAVGRSFRLGGSTAESFSVLVPEATLRRRRNDVRVFEVTRGGQRLRVLSRVRAR